MHGWEESRLILRGAFVVTNEKFLSVGSSFRGDRGVPVTTVHFVRMLLTLHGIREDNECNGIMYSATSETY